jgi:hypothetical protein
MLERTAGLEPTPPYGKYGALRSCVRKSHTAYPTLATAGGTSAERPIFCEALWLLDRSYADFREFPF